MTQLDRTTSTVLAGSGMASMWPLSQWTFVDARFGLVGAGELEHLVGHVEAVGGAGGGDAAGGEQDVDAAAGAEVEHDLAGLEVRHRRRVAAAQRRDQRLLGQLVALVAVEAAAEEFGLLVGDDRRVGAAAPDSASGSVVEIAAAA